MTALVCWRCGASLQRIPQPFERLAQCKACGADLHVCRLCKFYNPQHSDKCNHELAEPAREIDIANFCHYYRPRPGAHNPGDKFRADDAMAQLKALFGDTEDKFPHAADDTPLNSDTEKNADSAKARFDALFKND